MWHFLKLCNESSFTSIITLFNMYELKVKLPYLFRLLMWGSFGKLSLLLESCFYANAEVCHLIPLLSFFSAIFFFCCHNSHAGLPSSKSGGFSFKTLFKFSFCFLLSSTPSISSSFWTILWSFQGCLIASFFWFCAFLTLSSHSSLDKHLKFAVHKFKVPSLSF